MTAMGKRSLIAVDVEEPEPIFDVNMAEAKKPKNIDNGIVLDFTN